MPTPKFNRIINRALLCILLLIGIVIFSIAGTLGIMFWRYTYPPRSDALDWVNPIKNETFQVDLDLDAEGRSYHITRAYKCDDAITYITGQHSMIVHDVVPNQRVITQQLPSGHRVFIAVPNGCWPLRNIREFHIECARSNHYPYRNGIQDPVDCSVPWPVVRNHIPFVMWTDDIGHPTKLVAYATQESFKSDAAAVTRAVATIILKPNLQISPIDENEWLSPPFQDESKKRKRTEYTGFVSFPLSSCSSGFLSGVIASYRFGFSIPEDKFGVCPIPFTRDATEAKNFAGFLLLFRQQYDRRIPFKTPEGLRTSSVELVTKSEDRNGESRD